MGIIIAPLLLLVLAMLVPLSHSLFTFMRENKRTDVLITGLIIAIVELGIVLVHWATVGSVSAFMPLLTSLFYLSLLPLVLSALMNAFVPSVRWLSHIVTASVLWQLLISIAYSLVVVNFVDLFELLGISTYY